MADHWNLKYCPFYCEENVWHLAQHPELANQDAKVVVISNARRHCTFCCQRAAGSHEHVIWDYHVILLVNSNGWTVWDLDSTLELAVSCNEYLSRTFPERYSDDSTYAPWFRVIPSPDFVETFSSDRSHMLDALGHWTATPPLWPPILQGSQSTFEFLIDMRKRTSDTISLAEMQRMYGEPTGERRTNSAADADSDQDSELD